MSNRYMRREDGQTGSIPQDLIWNVKFDAAANATTLLSPQLLIDGNYEFVGARLSFSTASTSGTLTIEKCTGTTAAGSGTAISSAMQAHTVAANTIGTNQIATLAGTLANRRLTTGDRLTMKWAGTVTNLANCQVSIYLKKVQSFGAER